MKLGFGTTVLEPLSNFFHPIVSAYWLMLRNDIFRHPELVSGSKGIYLVTRDAEIK